MGQWTRDPDAIARKETLAQIADDMDNLRTALKWAIDRHKLDEVDKFLPAFGYFWGIQGWLQAGAEVFRLVTKSLRDTLDETDEQQKRMLARFLEWQVWYQKDWLNDDARRLAQEAISISLSLEKVGDISRVYDLRLIIAVDDAEARQIAQEALNYDQAVQSVHDIASHCIDLSSITLRLGEYDESLRLAQEALAFCRKHNIRHAATWALQMLCKIAMAQEDFIEAKRWADEALTFAEANGYRHAIMVHHLHLGDIARVKCMYAQAKLHFQESFVLAQEMRNPLHILLARNGLGRAVSCMGDLHEARKYFHESLKMARDSRNPDFVIDTLLGIAYLMAANGNAKRAVELITLPIPDRLRNGAILYCAERLRKEMEAILSPEVYAAAGERSTKLDLNAAVAELLAELSQPAQAAELSSISQPHADLLTERELEILSLIAEGMSNREIADQLVLAVSTVKWYVNEIFGKLHVTNRTQAVTRARSLGVLS
jgi:ATP/maltotriose-dependent transcriptional regulator MalT